MYSATEIDIPANWYPTWLKRHVTPMFEHTTNNGGGGIMVHRRDMQSVDITTAFYRAGHIHEISVTVPRHIAGSIVKALISAGDLHVRTREEVVLHVEID